MLKFKTCLEVQGSTAISRTIWENPLLFTKIHLYRLSVLYVLFYTLNAIKCLQSIKHCAHFSCSPSAFSFIFFFCSLNHFSPQNFADIQHNYSFSSLSYSILPYKFCILKISLGGRREEGSGWGTHVYLWRIHFDIWQN